MTEHRFEIDEPCHACAEGPVIVHTDADQHHPEKLWDWYCNEDDEAFCEACGATHTISLNYDGNAHLTWGGTSDD